MQWWSDYLDSLGGAKRRNLSGENGKNWGAKRRNLGEFALNLCALFAG